MHVLAIGTVLACAGLVDAPPPLEVFPRVGDVVTVDVTAKVDAAGEPAGWAAEAGTGTPAPGRGSCRTAGARAPSEHVLARVDLGGPVEAVLRWDGRAYAASGPQVVADPGWAVGDLALTRTDGTGVEVSGAIRFGGVPNVRSVLRDRDGSVVVTWDPVGEDRVVLAGVTREGVRVECDATETGGTLPWWAAPASATAVSLRSVRERVSVVRNEAVIRVRAAIERVVPLDASMTGRSAPQLIPGARRGPVPARKQGRVRPTAT